jgi:hypothetical protein
LTRARSDSGAFRSRLRSRLPNHQSKTPEAGACMPGEPTCGNANFHLLRRFCEQILPTRGVCASGPLPGGLRCNPRRPYALNSSMSEALRGVLSGIRTVAEMIGAFGDQDRCRRLLEAMVWLKWARLSGMRLQTLDRLGRRPRAIPRPAGVVSNARTESAASNSTSANTTMVFGSARWHRPSPGNG